MLALCVGIEVDSKTLTGWTAGAGIEWMFLPHWSLKAEYLYRSFSSQTFFVAQIPPGIPSGTVNINSGQVGTTITSDRANTWLGSRLESVATCSAL